MSEPSFVQRFFVAFGAYFRILFDAGYAARVLAIEQSPAEPSGQGRSQVRSPPPVPVLSEPALSELRQSASDPSSAVEPDSRAREAAGPPPTPSASEGALQLLALLQRQGRFVDFVEQDVREFSDAEIGQAARVVHEGCRAALRRYVSIEPVLSQAEGSRTEVPSGFDPKAIKLVGNVSGSAPYRGVLRHRGWRASELNLPETLEGHVFGLLAPAEVEI